MAGYIKLYRDIQEHWTWQDKPFSKGQAWVDLLMMANHDSNRVILGNEIILVERGCLITSEVKLAQRWGWSRHKVRDFLNLLISDSMIEKKSDSKKTYLKVLNYSVWQDSETTKGQQKDSIGTAKGQRRDTNKNDKNVKNEKNEKNNISTSGLSSDPVREKSKKAKQIPLFDETTEQYQLALFVRQCVLENLPNAKVPEPTPEGLRRWAYDIDLMMRIDCRGPDEIRELMDWAHKDQFWKANILSPGKLREKWDTLVAHNQRAEERIRGAPAHKSSNPFKDRLRRDQSDEG